MTLERLRMLADAYGGDLARWPQAEQALARELVRADTAAAAVLAEACALDDLLNASPRPAVSMALRDAVLAEATTVRGRAGSSRRFPMWRSPLWRNPFALASGAGWAAAACAGVVAGTTLTMHMTANIQADAVLYQATLTGVDDTEVLG